MRKASDRLNTTAGPGFTRGGLRRLRQFGRDRSGASALEFALVAVPLILLLFAILQVGLIYFANFTLENATSQGARLIRTGQAQAKNLDATTFKNEVCKNLVALLSCANLKLDVRRFSSFSGAELTEPLDSNGNLKMQIQLRSRSRRRRGRGQSVLCVGSPRDVADRDPHEQHERQ